jgi:hypothetical protein
MPKSKTATLTLRISPNDYLDEEAFKPVQVMRAGGVLFYEYNASEVLFSAAFRAYLTE